MLVLGVTHPISWNPAAALLDNGELVAMAEEERFNRFKYAPRIAPSQAIAYCLAEAGATLKDVDAIGVGWERAEAQWKKTKRYAWDYLASRLPFDRRDRKVAYVRHHLAHAVASYFVSGLPEANVISLDGYGGAEAGLLGMGRGADFETWTSIPTRLSWGHMYGKVTERLGFGFHRDEGKVMGLAAYGTPQPEEATFVNWNRAIPAIDPKKFRAFLERVPARRPGDPFLPEHKDLAATAQDLLERGVAQMARALHRKSGLRALCLAGGVALNCSMNGRLASLDFVDRLFINPASHDAGTALGAALWVYRDKTGRRPTGVLHHPFYGPRISSDQVKAFLEEAGITTCGRVEDPALEAADRLARGEVIGWFQARMEFGPRALGNRSILADPGEAGMADRVNDIKGRERWRPLSPSILAEDAGEYVEIDGVRESPFMLMAFPSRETARRRLPAVVHADGSARLQTVGVNGQKRFRRLLELFKERKGYGAVLNTSFNLAGQPIVCTPRDAVGTFFASGLDALVIEDWVVWK